MLPDLPQTEAAIVDMTNAFRKASTLQEVKPNAALAAAARALPSIWPGPGSSRTKRTAANRRSARKRRATVTASWPRTWPGTSTAAASKAASSRARFVEGWKGSSSHRENLLLSGATEIGVAVVRVPDKNPKFLSVQLFGRPESLKVTFSIQNRSSKAVTYNLGTDADLLQPRETVTHSDCDPRQLSIDKAGEAPARFNPRDGDRFVIRPGARRGIEVGVERR